MAEPGQTFPLEFALGILQTKQQLALRRAELNESREARRVQQSLEFRRQQIQQLAIQTESESDAANRQARLGMQQMELKSSENVAQARLQLQIEDMKQERDALQNNILAKIGKEPVYAPSWMKLPASIQGPLVKNEAGEEVPEYTVAVEPDEAGGHLIVPIRSESARMEYEKLRAQKDQILESSLLSTVRQRLVQAQTQNYMEKVRQLQAGMSPLKAGEAIKAWNEMKGRYNTEAIMSGKPLPEMTDEDKKIQQLIMDSALKAEAAARWQIEGPGPGAKAEPTALRMSPAEIAERSATADLEPKQSGEFKGPFDIDVLIDTSKGVEGAKFRYLNRGKSRPGPGEVPGKRRTYYDQTGKEVGFELYSNDGTFIKAEGRTPRSQTGPPTSTSPSTSAPPSASSGASAPPAVQPPANTQAIERRRELLNKIEANTATPTEQAEFLKLDAEIRGR